MVREDRGNKMLLEDVLKELRTGSKKMFRNGHFTLENTNGFVEVKHRGKPTETINIDCLNGFWENMPTWKRFYKGNGTLEIKGTSYRWNYKKFLTNIVRAGLLIGLYFLLRHMTALDFKMLECR